jgi:hypothetical protein
MTDTTDSETIVSSIHNERFQTRCRLRFLVAAVAVTTELGTVTSHVQRLAFAGTLFNNGISSMTLAMLVLANTTNRTNCLANPLLPGGNMLDSDIDFQINSIFTGIAVSRAWT